MARNAILTLALQSVQLATENQNSAATHRGQEHQALLSRSLLSRGFTRLARKKIPRWNVFCYKGFSIRKVLIHRQY